MEIFVLPLLFDLAVLSTSENAEGIRHIMPEIAGYGTPAATSLMYGQRWRRSLRRALCSAKSIRGSMSMLVSTMQLVLIQLPGDLPSLACRFLTVIVCEDIHRSGQSRCADSYCDS